VRAWPMAWCSATPLKILDSNDILIWVGENGNACGGTRTSGGRAGFCGRPDEFGPPNVCDDPDRLCPTDGRSMIPGIRGWWMGFADAGRGFYVFVGMGTGVRDPARAQAWDVLDSLRFLPRGRGPARAARRRLSAKPRPDLRGRHLPWPSTSTTSQKATRT
jgi:hypothetical protein